MNFKFIFLSSTIHIIFLTISSLIFTNFFPKNSKTSNIKIMLQNINKNDNNLDIRIKSPNISKQIDLKKVIGQYYGEDPSLSLRMTEAGVLLSAKLKESPHNIDQLLKRNIKNTGNIKIKNKFNKNIEIEKIDIVSSKLENNVIYPIQGNNEPPKYPLIARKLGFQGEVFLNVLVLENGSTGNVKIIKSSGYEMLDKSAIESIFKWKWKNNNVSKWINQKITFKMNN